MDMANRILESIKKNDNVCNILEISDNIYQINRKEGANILFSYIENKNINMTDIEDVGEKINFLMIVPHEWEITEDVMKILSKKDYSFGLLGDLHRYIRDNLNNDRTYDDESKFILERLSKDKNVKSIERIGQHIFRIYTLDNKNIDIFSIYEYDFGSYILEKYEFIRNDIKFIWSRNPYAQVTKDAEKYAKDKGLNIFKWSELLSFLNQKKYL